MLKARIAHGLKTALAAMLGFLIYAVVLQRPVLTAMVSKATGGDQPCPWPQLAKFPWSVEKFAALQADASTALKVLEEDAALGLQRIDAPGKRAFWIKKTGEDRDGLGTLAYILAEQDWIAGADPKHTVQKGDVVVDVGAHIGTFDDDALRRGAAKCILIEPDPVNVEAIRRNFRKEIEEGRIVVVPEGAWSSHSTLEFSTGVGNSGTGSFVLHEAGATKLLIPVRPIDEILAELGIQHVDFMKFDIEGAEREALKGANLTLKNSKPVLMIDSYHRSDDSVVLPQTIRASQPAYSIHCALCSPDRQGDQTRIVPYAIFFD
ncbi:MAG: FkbM family methyltransferase [Acidobacteriota bacterium]